MKKNPGDTPGATLIIVIIKVLDLPVEMFRGKSSNSLLHELIFYNYKFSFSDKILYYYDKLECPSDGTINMASEKGGILIVPHVPR